MKILVLGGTRFFGIHLVRTLLAQGHDVTIATRGRTADPFGDGVRRVVVDRTDSAAMARAFAGQTYDAVCDDIAYCSNDVQKALASITCERYVLVSSASIYSPWHIEMKEREFRPESAAVVWGDRDDFSYGEGKRQAEAALAQSRFGDNCAMVRFPLVVGPDDYTRRLRFYVEHAAKGIPMDADGLDAQITFIGSQEAGRFLAFLLQSRLQGPVNAATSGTVTLREILGYVEQKTGKAPLVAPDGDPAPYNGAQDFTLDTEKAQGAGFYFTNMRDWIFPLLETYLEDL